MPELKWTKAQRKMLHGFRTPHPADPQDAVLAPQQAWDALRALPILRELGKVPEEVAAMLEAREHETPPTQLDMNAEVAHTELVFESKDPLTRWEQWAEARALVGHWLGAEDFRFVIDVLTTDAPYERKFQRRGDHYRMSLVPAEAEAPDPDDDSDEYPLTPFGLYALHNPLYWALRNHVAVMDEDRFAAARDSVKGTLAHLPPGPCHSFGWYQRAMLVYVLSRDAQLVAEQIDMLSAAYDPQYRWEGAQLLACAAPTLDDAAKLGEHARFGDYSIDFVEAHGLAAEPILQASYDRARKYSAKQYLRHEDKVLKMLVKARG